MLSINATPSPQTLTDRERETDRVLNLLHELRTELAALSVGSKYTAPDHWREAQENIDAAWRFLGYAEDRLRG